MKELWSIFAFAVVLLSSSVGFSQIDQKIENQKAFTKLFGYARYFYPGDEASQIDFNKFAVYGASVVDTCRGSEELKQALYKLFTPFIPTLKIVPSGMQVKLDVGEITPNSKNLQTIAWQHLGVHHGPAGKERIYVSARTHRPLLIEEEGPFGSLTMHLEDVKKLAGREFEFSARMKVLSGSGTGHLWVRVDKQSGFGFFDNMMDRPVTSRTWQPVSVKGKIDDDIASFNFGAFLVADGELLLDSIMLRIFENNKWETVFSADVKNDRLNEFPSSLKQVTAGYADQRGYEFKTVMDPGPSTRKCISIRSLGKEKSQLTKSHKTLFKEVPSVGEYVNKEIGGGLKCIFPLALFGDEKHTYPVADSALLTELKEKLKAAVVSRHTADSLYVRLGALAAAWNVFRHFYFYFDAAKTDWEKDLETAIREAYNDRTKEDFLSTLRRLTSKLKDGHVSVTLETAPKNKYCLPLEWEWIEGQLVITNILEDRSDLNVGDVVAYINGKLSSVVFDSVRQYISAASKGWLEYKANLETILSYNKDSIVLRMFDKYATEYDVIVEHKMTLQEYWKKIEPTTFSRRIEDGIYYVNLDGITDTALKNLMPELEKCKSIIFDLRGYPSVGPDLISNLLSEKDTSTMWMRIPHIIYPDQESFAGMENYGWELRPARPHLNAKIFFLTDGSAISYAESFMGFIENYKLATIIGQPTAGTNGNVNPFTIPGGYRISWTGMLVYKHDGSRHHGVGIIPNVAVTKTIRGIRAGKDEFLEKAIELAKQ